MYDELLKNFESKFSRNLSDSEKIKLKELTKKYKRKEIDSYSNISEEK